MSIGYLSIQSLINVLSDSNAKAIETATITANGTPILLSLNNNYILNLIRDRGIQYSQFDNSSYWKKIVLTYAPNSTGQFKQLTFRLKNSSFKSYTTWSAISTIGTWYIKNIYVINKSGAVLKLSSPFGTYDDITVS